MANQFSQCLRAADGATPHSELGRFLFTAESGFGLGPFQGLPACLEIAIGKGVCGTAAQNREVLCVADVQDFPGHIACDPNSRSELVIPMLHEDRLVGVLDLDSPIKNRFSEEDRLHLKLIVQDLMARCSWPVLSVDGQ